MSTPHAPVTEFAILNLTPPTTLQNTQITSAFLEGIKAQPTWSGYPLHLFIHQSQSGPDAPNGTTAIYVVSGWESVDSHQKWMESPRNQELMRAFTDANLLSLAGLAHLDIDFTKLDFQECSQIIWRKRGLNDTVNWDDTSRWDKREAGSEGKKEARVMWSYRGRAVDKDVEEEYELVGFSDGVLPEITKDYTTIQKWNIEL